MAAASSSPTCSTQESPGSGFRFLTPDKYEIETQEPDVYPVLGELELSWDGPGAGYLNTLPVPDRNLSRYAALEFRVGVDFGSKLNSRTSGQDFSVTLQDLTGTTASVDVNDWSTALYDPPGEVRPLPKLLLNGVRIPLSAFLTANKYINLSNIINIRFKFNLRPKGALVFSNISLDDQAQA